jgi:LacI family transcriptional regulator
MRNSPSRRVAILYPASVPWFAHCLDGIRRYARDHGEWQIISSPPTLSGAEESALTLRSMRGWKGDAIIVASNDQRELRQARRMAIPVVNLAGGLRGPYGVPRVMVNHFAAGRMAAEHLLGRGLRHLAFFGWSNLWYSEERQRGFFERAEEAGVKCAAFLQRSGEEADMSWPKRVARPAKWLAALPRPTGIFAVQDYRAQFLVEVCEEAKLRIPEDIALVGMDNDETVCEHSVPTITSVSRNSERIGWEAMALLDRMTHGEPAPTEDLLLEPDRVVARQSTEGIFCTDPLVRRAVQVIRERLHAQVNVADLAERLGVSKRTLEMRFRDTAGSSPHEFLTRLRVERAQALMHVPEKRTVKRIALECGFGTAATVYAAFRRHTGESPGSFRRKLKG